MAHEEMFNIPGHKGTANQNHIKIPSLFCYNGYHQEHKQQQMLVRIWEKMELSYTVCGKQYGGYSEKLKIELPYDPAKPLLEIYPKKCKSGYNKDMCIPMFISELFTIASLWKQTLLMKN
jgi:hypothetical protein